MSELFNDYMKAGMNWLESDIVIQAKRKSQFLVSGSRNFELYKDLVAKHGEQKANELRMQKKMEQKVKGDYAQDVPHWMTHPDFPGDEAVCIPDRIGLISCKSTLATSYTPARPMRCSSSSKLPV